MLNRDQNLERLSGTVWDVVVIGGGATGLGTALDAISRGYQTLLLEAHDFAKGTSSRSTKLIHGGVRYLRQGNVKLVRESLRERGRLLANAPDIVRPLEFIVPTYSSRETMFYATGLTLYDFLAGRERIHHSRRLNAAQVLRRVPTLRAEGLYGGISYFDAQFDDARLAMALAQSISRLKGVVINSFPVKGLLKQGDCICGVVGEDSEGGRSFEISARVVINAAGVFSDEIRRMDEPSAENSLRLSQGIHIVLPREFLPGESAIIVPETDDGRVLFLIPWLGSILVGTTDTPVSEASLEPRPREAEIDYLLDHARRYLARCPTRGDIRSCFAGLRALVKGNSRRATSKLSRDHVVEISESGLVTITGGKWTTFRQMGEDAVDAASRVGRLPQRPSGTGHLKLESAPAGGLAPVGRESDGPSDDDVVRAVRDEMARGVEDVLARRSRLLFLDAAKAIEQSPRVATLMARELGRPDEWVAEQIATFRTLAHGYLVESNG